MRSLREKRIELRYIITLACPLSIADVEIPLKDRKHALFVHNDYYWKQHHIKCYG